MLVPCQTWEGGGVRRIGAYLKSTEDQGDDIHDYCCSRTVLQVCGKLVVKSSLVPGMRWRRFDSTRQAFNRNFHQKRNAGECRDNIQSISFVLTVENSSNNTKQHKRNRTNPPLYDSPTRAATAGQADSPSRPQCPKRPNPNQQLSNYSHWTQG